MPEQIRYARIIWDTLQVLRGADGPLQPRDAIEQGGDSGGRVVAQSRHHLDEAGRVPLRPDILWQMRGKPVAVIDAKYKAKKPSGYPNADLYQLLATAPSSASRSATSSTPPATRPQPATLSAGLASRSSATP